MCRGLRDVNNLSRSHANELTSVLICRGCLTGEYSITGNPRRLKDCSLCLRLMKGLWQNHCFLHSWYSPSWGTWLGGVRIEPVCLALEAFTWDVVARCFSITMMVCHNLNMTFLYNQFSPSIPGGICNFHPVSSCNTRQNKACKYILLWLHTKRFMKSDSCIPNCM